MDKGIIEIYVGVPCSGKTTHLNQLRENGEKIFSINRDDLRYEILKEYTGLVYSDFFEKPTENETTHDLYGIKTEDGCWSVVKELNEKLLNLFKEKIREAKKLLDSGENIVIDMLNHTVSEREKIINIFGSDYFYSAKVFEVHKNKDLILKLNEKRSKSEDKSIPNFIIEKYIDEMENPSIQEGFQEIKYVDGLIGIKRNITPNSKFKKI